MSAYNLIINLEWIILNLESQQQVNFWFFNRSQNNNCGIVNYFEFFKSFHSSAFLPNSPFLVFKLFFFFYIIFFARLVLKLLKMVFQPVFFSNEDAVSTVDGCDNLLLSGLFYQDVSNDLTYIHTQFIVMLILAAVLYFLSKLLSKKIFNLDKKSAYECGFEPFLILTTFIEVGFILVAFIFLIFDLELIFLSAFLVSSGSIGSFGILLVILYLFSVWVMVFFEVFSGVLSWPVWNIFSISSSFWFYSLFLKSRSWFGMVSLFSKACKEYAYASFDILSEYAEIEDFEYSEEEYEEETEYSEDCESYGNDIFDSLPEAERFYKKEIKARSRFSNADLGLTFSEFDKVLFNNRIFSRNGASVDSDSETVVDSNKIDLAALSRNIGDGSLATDEDFFRVMFCGGNSEYQVRGNSIICPVDDVAIEPGITLEYDSNLETEDDIYEAFLKDCSRPGKNTMMMFLVTILDYFELSCSCFGFLFFEKVEYIPDYASYTKVPAPSIDLIFFKDSFGFTYAYQEACFRFIADDLVYAMFYEDALITNPEIIKVWILQLEFQGLGVDEIHNKTYDGMITMDRYMKYLRTEWPLADYWWLTEDELYEIFCKKVSVVVLAAALSRQLV